MKTIFVVGTSGSGKSTLAKYLAHELKLKHIELDAIQWLPDWKQRPLEEFKSILQKEVSNSVEGYVIDGNFTKLEISIPPGSVVIFLDYPRLLVFQRILRRSLRRVITREELWSGNREELKFLLTLNPEMNPVLWSWKTHKKRRASYSALIAELSDENTVFRITNRAELKRLKKILSN